MQPARGRSARFDLDRQIASTFPAHWTSGRIPTKWSLSLPPGGRDCWLPHDSGAGLCWQHVGGVGSTTTTTTTTKLKLMRPYRGCQSYIN